MSQSELRRIRNAFLLGLVDLTAHAYEELAEDDLDLSDLDSAVADGMILRVQQDAGREPRYTVVGTASDKLRRVGFVGRFVGNGTFLVITGFHAAPEEG